MVKKEKAIRDLERKVRVEMHKDLKKEGFEGGYSAGNDPDGDPRGQCLNELVTETINKYHPREIKLINEAVFYPDYGKDCPSYFVFYK